jgi:uncharacterized protein YbjT (DUF2867 family)
MGLRQAGWQVRGTTRDAANAPDIEEAGIEAAVADPQHPGTVLDHVGDAALVFWLLGSAGGDGEGVAAVNGRCLERVLEELVDTPVRGFVYEGAGTVDPVQLGAGARIVQAAGDRWRIPAEVVTADPGDWEAWTGAMLAAAERLIGSARA